MTRVLVLYSNPSNTGRIRLDKEHRAIDQVVERLGLSSDTFTRCHATSIDDLVRVLSGSQFDIIHFSGHGSEEGFYLEHSQEDRSEIVDPLKISSLLKQTQPNLELAIFMCCYSSSSIIDLIDIAPYLITVREAASDKESIEFIELFYETLFKKKSIENAFFVSDLLHRKKLTAILSRRAQEKYSNRVLFQVFPIASNNFGDSVLVDLTEAEDSISVLNLDREKFLAILTRKIRLHRWIFDFSRERTILAVGPFFGVFSWQNSRDIVVCHKILKIRQGVADDICTLWASLIVSYNDLYINKYRTLEKMIESTKMKVLGNALKSFHKTFEYYFDGGKNEESLKAINEDYFKTVKASVWANLRQADLSLNDGDLSSTVIYLETALSSIHDFIDGIAESITEG